MDELLQRVRVALADSYEIESEIGRGGMAIIYLGRDRRHDRPVAVKILPPHLASAIGHERFLQEIRMAAGLSHPYILPVLDSGERDGMLYYTMPFVEGENLRERLAREPELPIEDALRIADEMAEALGHAHGLGIVHRDVKPSNILLTPEHALLADFGVARAISRGADENLTGTGLSVGTPAYMSPQQGLADEGLDGASDQYSLACVIYEMIAGGPPFAAPTPDAVLRRHVMDPVPPLRDARPSVPAAVESTLERALSKSPAARFPSMAEFASSLRATGGADGSGSLAARRETSPGRRATLVAGGGLVLVATAFGLSSLVRGGSGAGAAASPYRLALLPCQAVVEADGVLGRNVANGVFLGLQGFTTIKPTPFAQSEAWAVEQALRGVSMSDSVANARDRLNTSTLGTCTIEPVGDDSIEVNYQLWSSDRDYVSEDVRLARTTSVYADVDPFVVALAGLLCDGSTSCGSSFRPTENVQAFSYYLEADELFLQDR
ncbi:MAG: serine/threonine protein kinase, partial [Gemmatimonadota bacterium]|nr:serine/threonine protein kinase [Gemmatimonadota bacterium]